MRMRCPPNTSPAVPCTVGLGAPCRHHRDITNACLRAHGVTSPSTLARMSIERVFVAGAGLMGHGIAQVHAAIGKQLALYQPALARAQAGRDRIAGNLDRAVAKGKLDAGDRESTLARID